MPLTISVLADRPDLYDAFTGMTDSWPEFMRHDPVGNLYYSMLDRFADYILVCQDEAGEVVGRAYSSRSGSVRPTSRTTAGTVRFAAASTPRRPAHSQTRCPRSRSSSNRAGRAPG
ncbi:hypothetical protein ACWF99_01195 [Nocardia sp. NPDC055002]